MRPNATLLRHFAHNANSDLRRIACDFLTSRIRVGEANLKPTDERPWELPPTLWKRVYCSIQRRYDTNEYDWC